MKNFIKRAINWIVFGVPQNTTIAKITTTQESKILSNKKVLITGGGRGLGYYIAEVCVKNGAEVMIVGRNEATLKEASQKLNCKYEVFDMNNINDIDTLIEKAYFRMNGLNVIINNAGVSYHEKGILDVTIDGFEEQFKTNLEAPYFMSKSFIKLVKEKDVKNPQILFITSERGLYCDIIPYGLTKCAINSLTEGLGRAYAGTDMRVNAIAPGVTASEMTKVNKDGNLYRESLSSKRVFVPEEVAEVALFLLSDCSSSISGHIIPCNKGNHLRCDWQL